MTRLLKIAVQGCCHGELNAVYKAIAAAEEKGGYKTDLLIVGGDFQSIRNLTDLSCMAVPAKFRKLGDFADYYAGKKTAPVLTIFVGGNHEASNYLQELFYGGWVAPNIYYLGAANVVNFGGLRIGGISGIWSKYDYVRGHSEKAPYDKNSLRSVYHVRQFEVKKLLSMNSQHDRCDIFLSHDWPRGIEQYGDTRKLLRNKPFFKEEIARNDLGSPANEELLRALKPRYWFCAHLHVRFEASVHHADTGDKRPRPGSVSPGGLHHKAKTRDLVVDSSNKINPDEIDLDLEDETDDPDEIALELPDEEVMNPQDNCSSLTAQSPMPKPESAEQSTANMSLEEYKQHVLQKNGVTSVESSDLMHGHGAKDNVTQFLALDKCLPRRQFLEIMTIPVHTEETSLAQADLRLRYDAKWLAITRTYSPYLSKSAYQKKLPDHATILAQLEADERWICENVSDLKIPRDFARTAPCQSPDVTERSSFVVHQNPQTTKFLQLIGLPIVD